MFDFGCLKRLSCLKGLNFVDHRQNLALFEISHASGGLESHGRATVGFLGSRHGLMLHSLVTTIQSLPRKLKS